MLAFDLDRGKTRRQRAACHDVLGADCVCCRVETDEVAGPDVDGAYAQSRAAGVDAVKIDQALQRALEISGIIEARRLDRSGRLKPRPDGPCPKKAACAVRKRKTGAHLIEKIASDVAPRQPETRITEARPTSSRGHLRPELAQPINADLGRVPGDQGGVDRTDRHAGDPIGMDGCLRERFVNSGLIGPERATALQHQSDPFEGKAPFGCNCARLDLNVHGMLSIFAPPRFSAQVECRRQSRLRKS
jgi:hypothetical protein